MAQINVQIRENGEYRHSKSFLDDLTLRSYTGQLIMINSNASVSSGGAVFVIRDTSETDVAFINQLGDATFHHLTITGNTTIEDKMVLTSTLDVSGKVHFADTLTVDATSEFKNTASGYFNINQGFSIDSVSTSSTVTAANLNTLTNGSSADTLHNHRANKDIDIVVASSEGDYSDLWLAYADASAGDVILVTNNQTTAIQRILNKQIEIIFKPGVEITCSTSLVTSVIRFGTDIITKNFKLKLSQTSTTSIGYDFEGDTSYHENIKLIMDDGGAGTGIVSEAYVINAGKKGNFAKGLVHKISGTVTTACTDNSGNTNNVVSIRNIL